MGPAWLRLGSPLLLALLVPFALFGADVDALAQRFLSAHPPAWQVALVLGGLLAGDILLPVPSSLAATAAGGLLGFAGGLATNWVGMMVACAVGYGVGTRAGAAALRRMAGDSELERLARTSEKLGPWFLLVFRAVPVLAEASVVFAGTSRMSFRRFFTVCALSNLGVSATYAALGATAAELESFLVLFAGMVLVPGLALAWVGRRDRARLRR
ncbi:VTT domain-containing protein [Pyxidicoccus sp. 3LG]